MYNVYKQANKNKIQNNTHKNVAGSRFVAPSGDQVVKVRGIHENPIVHMPPSSDQSITTFNRFVASSGDQLVIKFVEHMQIRSHTWRHLVIKM